MSSSPLRWEPASLTFPIALSKPSVAELVATNTSSSSAYSFKVKTTNPKRYCVRPNVGIVWPGKEARVSVQLPAMREYPSDMNKCKDKFQVLTLALSAEQAAELEAVDVETQRKSLSDLWGSDEAKGEAIVDKIRCSFTFDSSYRGASIPEEEHPVAPYSPEAPPAADAPTGGATPTAQTPAAEGREAAATPAARTLDPALDAAASVSVLRERLVAAERANAELKAQHAQAVAGAASAQTELKEKRQLLAASSKGGGGKGGTSAFTVLLFVLAAFGAGWAAGSAGGLVPMGGAADSGGMAAAPRGKRRDEL